MIWSSEVREISWGMWFIDYNDIKLMEYTLFRSRVDREKGANRGELSILVKLNEKKKPSFYSFTYLFTQNGVFSLYSCIYIIYVLQLTICQLVSIGNDPSICSHNMECSLYIVVYILFLQLFSIGYYPLGSFVEWQNRNQTLWIWSSDISLDMNKALMVWSRFLVTCSRLENILCHK